MRYVSALILLVIISSSSIAIADIWGSIGNRDDFVKKTNEIQKINDELKLKDDDELRVAYKKLLLVYIKAEEQRVIEERRVISQSNKISYFIFFVAHLFLMFGIYAAYAEFKS